MINSLMWIDVRLFRAINAFAYGPFDSIGVFIANTLIVVLALGALLPLIRGKIMLTARILLAGVVAFFVTELIKLLIHRPRPFAALSGVHQLIAKGVTDWSFPSGHAAVAFALAVGISVYSRTWGRAAFFLAALVALGRVVVGVHYPSDVIAGAALGAIVARLVVRRR